MAAVYRDDVFRRKQGRQQFLTIRKAVIAAVSEISADKSATSRIVERSLAGNVMSPKTTASLIIYDT